MPPIFFAATRSFWLGIVPILMILLDVAVTLAADATSGPPVAGVIARALGFDAAAVEAAMLKLAPLFALVIAQQRAGKARPYTLRATRDTIR
jgi:hypothetical protein